MPTIRVVDIETTGMSPAEGAEVIELGWQDVFFDEYDGGRAARIDGPTLSRLYGSERPCPPEVLAVHHIRDHEREGLPLFFGTGGPMGPVPRDTIAFAAHNSEYEQSFLMDAEEPQRWLGLPFICTMKCAMHAWPLAPKHSNQVLRYWLGLDSVDTDRAHPPHRAGPDAYVTAHILSRLLQEHSLEQLLAWTAMSYEEARAALPFEKWPFGKHRGVLLVDTDKGYLDWVISKSDMEPHIKRACQAELRRRAEARQAAMRGTGPLI